MVERPEPPALDRARLVLGLVPNVTLAAMLGMSPRELYRRRDALGLPSRSFSARRPTRRGKDRRMLRRVPRKPNASTALPPPRAVPAAPIDRLAVGQAMERFISERIAACEADATAGRDREPERTARTVAHYARALGLVRAHLVEIEKDRRIDGEPPARTLSELRDELRGHLERIWDEGANAGGLPGPCDDPVGD